MIGVASNENPSFLWIHIKKAAGQSIRKALDDVYVQTNRSRPTPFVALPKAEWNDNLNNFRIPLGDYDYRRMLFAKRFLFPEGFNEMFKFCIVRNPYNRAVSAFLYEIRNDRSHVALTRAAPRRMFRHYLRGLPRVWEKTKPRHRALHSAPVIPDITDDDGNLLVDFIARLESISQDLNHICDNLGIERRPLPQVHVRGRKTDPLQFYDGENQGLVETLYGEDIERLGYSFPEGK
jgi:hypothetical protein